MMGWVKLNSHGGRGRNYELSKHWPFVYEAPVGIGPRGRRRSKGVTSAR